MNKTPVINILMSTYNGSKYLDAQIDSIFSQKDVEIILQVRDDGSTDETPELIERALERFPFEFRKGANFGVVGSFFDLLKNSRPECDYYAFSDQDDVWKAEKLFRASQQLAEFDHSVPALYYSRLEFTDERLNTIGFSAIPSYSGYANALVQNQATGCTIVMNKAARDLLISRLPEWALMHDWWCYLVVSAFGNVVYDSKPTILYRKHGNNVTPATPWFILELWERTKRYISNKNIPEKVTDQVNEFISVFGDLLDIEKRDLAEKFIEARSGNFFSRLNYVLHMKVRRNTILDNQILKILILLGKF